MLFFSFSGRGLTIDWSTVWLSAVLLTAIFIVWLNYYFVPGSPKEWFIAEFLFVTFLMVLLTNVLVPMQYGALAMGAPFADPWLAAADAAMGVHVPTLAAWTRAHPVTSQLATLTYFTFAPQLLLTLFVAGRAARPRASLGVRVPFPPLSDRDDSVAGHLAVRLCRRLLRVHVDDRHDPRDRADQGVPRRLDDGGQVRRPRRFGVVPVVSRGRRHTGDVGVS